ncbi:conserved Plasmodium protein, unknown function [Plasmodium gallinaceum]|uniref:CCAAT-box DNA binding protein subunit B n=1 Tax=Plasmodium gallinaceum TaxID=5849 RepID=A0A1J1GMU5_PLAGA|nr:conserved Plasmodium protein, unknown function [Plasmodium gallinaceum]CRG93758.1 conserved Plasmodium protein, unknown function [Plasmodium gallinaceum]
MSIDAEITSLNMEIPINYLDVEIPKKTKLDLKDRYNIYFNYHGSAFDDNSENKSNLDNCENMNVNEESHKNIEKESMNNLNINLSENYKKVDEKDDSKFKYMGNELNDNDKILDNEKNDIETMTKEEEKINISEGSEKKLYLPENQNISSENNKENEKMNNLNNHNEMDLYAFNEIEERKKRENENSYSNLNGVDNIEQNVPYNENDETKNNKINVDEEINDNNENIIYNNNIINDNDNNCNSPVEKCEIPENEEQTICSKNDINEYSQNNIELHKIKNKELEKGKKGKNKNKFFSLFKKKAAPNLCFQEKEMNIEVNNKSDAYTNDNTVDKSDINNLNEGDVLEEKKILTINNEYNNKNSEENVLSNNLSNSNAQSSLNVEFIDIHKDKNHYVKNENSEYEINSRYIRDDHIYSIKTDDHIILDLQEHREINFNESGNYNKLNKENKNFAGKTGKKIYSFEKIKSFVSNNTYLKDKKSFIIEKKSKISKEVKYFCFNYSMFLCILLYMLCFSFVLTSLLSDSWKIHEITLKSKNNEKSVLIHIGATTIRRIQKISEKNGDVNLSIDKEQTMESLINNEFCKSIKKSEMENYLVNLASENKLISNSNLKDNEIELTDDNLISALRNPGDVGLLKDEKLIMARKYIFGPTIYNLECKFLEKLKKAGNCHKVLLYAILIFLFISIFLLLYVILKYKVIKNIQGLKYTSFVLVNLALITLISSIFSINREYNIPLCVQNDGSSDICVDGKSIHLIRSTIILIIFSNLFFSKFLNKSHNKNNTIEESIAS